MTSRDIDRIASRKHQEAKSAVASVGEFSFITLAHTQTPRDRGRDNLLIFAQRLRGQSIHPIPQGQERARDAGLETRAEEQHQRDVRGTKKNAREKKLSVEQVQFPMEWRFWRRDRICCWEKEHAKVVPPTIHGKAGRSAKGLFTPSDKNIEKSGCEN